MAIETNLAGVVRVAYEAVTGEFNRDVDVAARNYAGANEHMSDSAIKLELAQDRLRRAIAKGPAAEREQARALLQVRAAERELESQTRRTTAETTRQGRELDATAARARRGSGAFRSLRSGIAFATAGLLGGTGLIYALKSVREAANEAETSSGRVRVAVRNAGIDYDRYAKQIDNALARQSALAAFDDEELADVFAKLVIRTRDVNEALTDTALVTDVARGRQISLEAATSLVLKASLNQAGQLRRVGIEVGKVTTAEQLLAKLRQTYHGQAAEFAKSDAGAQERFNVVLENSEEIIGRRLTPALAGVTRKAAEWLDAQARSGDLQRNVNTAVETGTKIIHGLADGLRIVKRVAEPVVDALGGIEKAAQLALILGIAAKVRRAAGSFGPLQIASRSTATRGVADAATFGRAWDLATRPRSMVVTTTAVGGGAPVPGRQFPQPIGPQPKGRRFPIPPIIPGGLSKIPFRLGLNPETAVLFAVLESANAGGTRARAGDPTKYPRVMALLRKVQQGGEVTPAEQEAIRASGVGSRSISELRPEQLAALNTALAPQVTGVLGGDRDRPNMGQPIPRQQRTPPRTRPTRRPPPPRRTDIDVATDLARALTTPGTSDEERLYGEQITRFRSEIAVLERRKTLTDEQKQKLQSLYGSLGSAQSSLEAIRSAREQALDDARDAAARKRATKRRQAAAKAKREQAAETRAAVNDAKSLSVGARKQVEARFPMGDKRLERIDPRKLEPPDKSKRTSSTDDGTVTREELASFTRDLLTSWGQMIADYFPNIAGGSVSSNPVLEHLTREQTGVLREAVKPRTYRRPVDDAVFG